jgi:hypothetical protein
LRLGFTFEDGAESIAIDKPTLMQALSTGESILRPKCDL